MRKAVYQRLAWLLRPTQWPRKLKSRYRRNQLRAGMTSAQASASAKDWDQAIAHWRSVVKMPGVRVPAKAFLGLARAYSRKGEFELGETALREGLEHHEGHLKLMVQYAETASSLKAWPTAIERWKDVIERHGFVAPPKSYLRLTQAYLKGNDYHDAIATVERGLLQYPEDPMLSLEADELAKQRRPEALAQQRKRLDAANETLRHIAVVGQWGIAYDACKCLVDAGSPKPVYLVIYDKKQRPEKLIDQFHLLFALSDVESLAGCHRVNALIAAGHKAMEAMCSRAVDQAIDNLELRLKEVEDQKWFSDNIREDKTHILFSGWSVLWHLYLWRADLDGFVATGEAAARYYASIDPDQLTKGFYQSCTNVARCLSAAYMGRVLRGEFERCDELTEMVSSALYHGVCFADNHKVKFAEFLRDTRIYHQLRAVEACLPKTDGSLDQAVRGQLMYLIAVTIRGHGEEKSARIKANFKCFVQTSLSLETECDCIDNSSPSSRHTPTSRS